MLTDPPLDYVGGVLVLICITDNDMSTKNNF